MGATFLFTCQGSSSIRSVREKAKNRWKVASVAHMNEGGGGGLKSVIGKLPAPFSGWCLHCSLVSADNLPAGVGG